MHACYREYVPARERPEFHLHATYDLTRLLGSDHYRSPFRNHQISSLLSHIRNRIGDPR